MKIAFRDSSLVLMLALYVAAVAALMAVSMRLSGGVFIYPLDDTYIHLAVARQFALHHVWGMAPGVFASCTSSPLWTFLLAAAYGAGGVHETLPVVLSALFGACAMVMAHRFLRDRIDHPMMFGAVLLTMIAATPLPALAVSGMEHVLHVALSIAFFAAAVELIADGPGDRRNARLRALVLAPLLVAARYEGLFLVACACVLLARRGARGYTLALGAAALVPVVAYGAWSMAHGWYFLPNSVLLKANLPTPKHWAEFVRDNALATALRAPHLLMLIQAAVLLAVLGARNGRRGSAGLVAAKLFVGAALLHLTFARVGWLYRYEAYLVFLGIATVAILANECRGRLWPAGASVAWRGMVAVGWIALAFPLAERAFGSLVRTPRAAKNIHDQQYQMGRFLDRHYHGAAVAANDVGAVAYLGQVDLLDLFGLGTMEVARLKLHGDYDTAKVRALARERKVKVAVIYDEWLEHLGGVPAEWTRIGEWKIEHNVVCDKDHVVWYAIDPAERRILTANLRSFSDQLPRDVHQSGSYVEP